eukprot:scaffold7911_cov632-Prasinococcus_capsulatus_cf.AAC.1
MQRTRRAWPSIRANLGPVPDMLQTAPLRAARAGSRGPRLAPAVGRSPSPVCGGGLPRLLGAAAAAARPALREQRPHATPRPGGFPSCGWLDDDADGVGLPGPSQLTASSLRLRLLLLRRCAARPQTNAARSRSANVDAALG